jgi:hypothetical protein
VKVAALAPQFVVDAPSESLEAVHNHDVGEGRHLSLVKALSPSAEQQELAGALDEETRAGLRRLKALLKKPTTGAEATSTAASTFTSLEPSSKVDSQGRSQSPAYSQSQTKAQAQAALVMKERELRKQAIDHYKKVENFLSDEHDKVGFIINKLR